MEMSSCFTNSIDYLTTHKILLTHLSTVEKQSITTTGTPLLLRCKNFLSVTFIIAKERDCHDIYQSLLKLARPASVNDLYAFQYMLPKQRKGDGWDMYDIQSEYLRMGVPNREWVLTNINRDYEICDTYSRFLYVPTTASTPVIVGSSKFRSKGRIPVLSYLHRDNQAAICRCSQPLSGFSARCQEDEQLLQAIKRANPGSKYMYIIDTRPKINAMVNKAAGKGYENETFYTDIKFHFLGIENIHTMRGSLQKMLEVCELKNPPMNEFISGIESSGWLKHIRAIMDTSVFIAQAVRDGISVMIHCSDGWDRTAQTGSLASIMLDPYYRTIPGMQVLIEKEWLSFGHKFTDRCGHLDTVDAREMSPVFTQFLDCVWQFTQQYPCAFQFNDRFLVTLHDHVFSCQFGTFIGNCEKDRLDLRLSERTYSVWAYFSENMSDFLNPLYQREYEISHPVLIPDASPQNVKFWTGMYNRYDSGLHPRESVQDTLGAMKDHSTSLEDHARLLEKRITHICKLLGQSEEKIQQRLDGYSSSESVNGILSRNLDDLTLPPKITKDADDVNTANDVNVADDNLTADDKTGKVPNLDEKLVNMSDKRNERFKTSDSESGFDESSSQMSRSGPDDLSPQKEMISMDQLLLELKSVAIKWDSLRDVTQCSCATPFEYFSKKYHCWRCGSVFCGRCITRATPLPGHYTQRPVPVCKPCYTSIHRSPSLEYPAADFPSSNSR